MPRAALTAPGVPAPLDGFDYPAPRFPRYLLQERTDDIEELMPLARAHVRRRYGRSALGDVQPGDELLIVTFPHQNEIVFDALRRALLEIGVEKVDRIDVTDLGMEVREYSAADGWREITDRLPPMIEEGVEFNVAAAALKRFLDDRPGYTGVYAGEAGRSHWKRAAGKRIRNNWVYSTYEDFIGRANGVPDEIWRTVDLMVVDAFRNAAAVRITSPEGTDIGWEVTEQQAELWPQGAYISGHILGSTIQGIRFGHPAETFLREAKQLMPTLNGVIGGTSNHTGYYPHIQVTIEGGMIANIDGRRPVRRPLARGGRALPRHPVPGLPVPGLGLLQRLRRSARTPRATGRSRRCGTTTTRGRTCPSGPRPASSTSASAPSTGIRPSSTTRSATSCRRCISRTSTTCSPRTRSSSATPASG